MVCAACRETFTLQLTVCAFADWSEFSAFIDPGAEGSKCVKERHEGGSQARAHVIVAEQVHVHIHLRMKGAVALSSVLTGRVDANIMVSCYYWHAGVTPSLYCLAPDADRKSDRMAIRPAGFAPSGCLARPSYAFTLASLIQEFAKRRFIQALQLPDCNVTQD